MKQLSFLNTLIVLMFASLLSACASSPTGRTQLYIFPDTQMDQMGVAAFDSLKKGSKVSTDKRQQRYVQCIADAIIAELPEKLKQQGWETQVFADDTPNAFALPGGKIGVHTGMFKVASDANQLASVIGHEVGHVWAKHGNERMSQQYLTQTGLDLVGTLAGELTEEKAIAMQLLGVGAQVGVILPFSRTHESEADEIGLDLMAKAGFNPEASVTVWQNMSKLSQGGQPEFLSTHPSNQTRIKELTKKMSKAKVTYQAARTAGKKPKCRL